MVDIKDVSESMLKQVTATVDRDGHAIGQYPDYPIISAAEAVEMLDAETHWIRSANLEYYYRYAVIENAKTEERFVVNKWTEGDQWAIVLKWLADVDDHIEIVCKDAKDSTP